MNILRKLGVGLCASILSLALLGLVASHAASATVLQRDTVKQWLDSSNFYDRVVDTIMQAAEDLPEEESGGDTASLSSSDPRVRAIVKQAFTPELLRTNIEKVLDGTYAWLEGETDRPVFQVDLSVAKQQLAEGLSSYAIDRASSLPACPAEQSHQLTAEGRVFDALSSTCLPPGVDPQAAGATVRDEILSSEDFLGQTSYSGDDIGVQEADREKFQDAYQAVRKAPYLLTTLALLSAAGVVFLSTSRRAGVRRASIVLVTTGIILGVFRVGTGWATGLLEERAADAEGNTKAGGELIASLLRTINQDVGGLLSWYALGFILIGIAGLLLIWLLGRRNSRPQTPQDPTPPIDDTPTTPQAPAPAAHEPGEKTKPNKQPRKIQL